MVVATLDWGTIASVTTIVIAVTTSATIALQRAIKRTVAPMMTAHEKSLTTIVETSMAKVNTRIDDHMKEEEGQMRIDGEIAARQAARLDALVSSQEQIHSKLDVFGTGLNEVTKKVAYMEGLRQGKAEGA